MNDELVNELTFNDDGVCNFCEIHDGLEAQYPKTGYDAGVFKRQLEDMKRRGKGRKYDCLIGLSGGCDSSYMIHLAVKEFGLRPLVVHFDNRWNTPAAEHNIKVMVEALNVDFIRYQINREEFQVLNEAFLAASTPDADIPNDLAMLTLFMETAVRYDIKYVFNGHDFRSEGTCPLSWTYMDARYVSDVYRRYSGEELKNYPNLTLWKQIKWAFKNIKAIRPLYYVDYDKPRVKEMLAERYGWEDYGAHHCENVYTAFIGAYLWPKKFGIDLRLIEYSALIRSGRLAKEEARKLWEIPPELPDGFLEEVQARTCMSDAVLEDVMSSPKRSFKDFDSYHSIFVRYRLIVWMLVKLRLLPNTFYEKYTKEI
jgi:N-acetyl sugar amidotransferase